MKKTMLIVLALAGFAVQNGAADGGGFADFRKQQQARLLAAIDSTLATQAENAITGNFAAVKKAGVQLQTGLGGRKANIGINFIGSFAESENRAFGWQLRGYAAKEDAAGLNAGVFYRQTSGEMLFGANAFADYEKHDYGNFFRYSIGGELQHSIFALAANYYIPQTDNRKVNMSVAAFSREGYDAKLRIAAPHYKALKAAVDYYHFDGEGDTKAESGFRYGMELQPNAAFRFGLYYDNEGEKFGGDIAYSFGEEQKRESNAAFSPDMFAAVSREYSQRIATVATITDNIRPVITTMRITTRITAAAITTTARMTAAAMTTRTTIITMPLMAIGRVASVHFTARIFVPDVVVAGNLADVWLLATTNRKFEITLPPAPVVRPLVITVDNKFGNRAGGNRQHFNVHTDIFLLTAGQPIPGSANPNLDYTLTIVEGSEEVQETINTTTTLTTRTTTTMPAVSTTTRMTMAAVSTTTRLTTFATTFITLTANSAMGGNNENNTPPNFPHKRAAFSSIAPRTFFPTG